MPTIQWESIETRYVNTGMGWQPPRGGVKYNINVLPFFDEMLDRSDMTIKVTGGCDGAVGARDAELSRAWESPCVSSRATSSRHLPRAIAAHWKYIGWMQEDQESHTAIYAKGWVMTGQPR